jgi:hypothetical protein
MTQQIDFKLLFAIFLLLTLSGLNFRLTYQTILFKEFIYKSKKFISPFEHYCPFNQ